MDRMFKIIQMESKFYRFAGVLMNDVKSKIPQYFDFAKAGFEEFGRGAIMLYPSVYTEYDLSRMEDARVVTQYLSLDGLSKTPGLVVEGRLGINEMKEYDPTKEFVVCILPYDEDDPNDSYVDIDSCHSEVIKVE